MSSTPRFSANINTFNAGADRYVLAGYGERLNTDQLIEAATKVPGLTGVELVGLWHVNDSNVEQIGRQVRDAGFEVTCVTPDIWASGKWGWGSFAANDPQIRRDAIREVQKSMEWARQLNCKVVDLWFGQDGYDYPLQADFPAAWDRIIEGTIASVPPQGGRKHPNQDFVQVDTTNILFVCGGAFDGLDKVIRNRTEKFGIGFGAEVKSRENEDVSEALREVEPGDLIKFGLIPELIGRLPVVATLQELDEEALIQILVEPKNALIKQYQKLFSMEGVELEVRPAALQAIARKALKRKTGARGLRSILEGTLLDTMYELPSMENVSKVVIDEGMIEGGAKPILIYADQPKVSGSN